MRPWAFGRRARNGTCDLGLTFGRPGTGRRGQHPAADHGIGVAPAAGSGIDPDKIPANVPQPLGPEDFDHAKAPDLLQAMTRSFPFTSLTNQSGNQFQQDANYRGFVASLVPGTPQGIAVYQNGVRVNEAYGDVVNWSSSRKPPSTR
jgi:iron complex outermembrane receptor protein